MKKAGVSSLNAYAASYVPVAKKKDPTVKDIKPGNEAAAWFEPCSLMRNPGEMSAEQITVSYEDFNKDLEFLAWLSSESVLNVYLENNRDPEATIDRLNRPEMYTVESAETLPVTLDIGDVTESRSSTLFAGRRPTNAAGETGGASSSSGSMESYIASLTD
ncbi:hypothetical protein F3Y22_tig00112632pilonHSYRG00049 [Hibiscus syriacus]|uniref:Uncharacterized protein n=1 Tax=Hibiscus syriacus TaxID=106335 RepID=A0A6A2XDN9_HIBSY|nr:polyadenylate-binding protein-interacting protein 5-like [Hibiscus syriacus]KAE8665345.1 hypothetical protein F3Y22_tig00112632pilonHSYRG00049 [Hibiscus syriacus]